MKRKERHHLKENDLAQTIIRARETFETRGSEITRILLAVAVVAGLVVAFMAWRGQGEARAEAALGEAMVTLNAQVVPATSTPAQPGEVPAAATMGAVGTYATESAKLTAALPKLKAAADAYPDTEAGITARYHYGTALAALGRHTEALQAFDDVIGRAESDSIYGRMARLGKADTQMQAGQLDAAIETWTELSASTDEDLPKDAILMELGRAYAAKGNREEARKAFTQIVDEHPTSPYTAEARAELGS
jgi:tetratricopeptide (TPR) repeat protein